MPKSHMWNGPADKSAQQRYPTRERCGHMFGLEARPQTAGLDEVREVRGRSYLRAQRRSGFGGLSHIGMSSLWVSSLLLHLAPAGGGSPVSSDRSLGSSAHSAFPRETGFAVDASLHEKRPDDARRLVGQRYGGDLGRPACQNRRHPG